MSKSRRSHRRKGQKPKDLNSSHPSHEQNERQPRHSLNNMKEFGQTLGKARSALNHQMEELKSVIDSFTEMEEFYKKNLHDAGSALKQYEEELKSVKDSMTEMEKFYQLYLREANLAEMEAFYKEKLNKARSAVKEIEEEFKSFKNRVADEVTPSIKTGNTESMNSPVSKTKLTEMYDDLRLCQWPKIKDQLKSEQTDVEQVKPRIQSQFKEAADQMETKKQQIDEVFRLIENNSGLTPQKVEELRRSAIQSLQLEVYHSRTDDKTPVPQHGGHYLQKIMEKFRLECSWLGCLMALNNPPLQPDWENHVPGMDEWDIFPKKIRAVSAV
ncbi:uncharacterized protein LOC108888437 [Lates calcarifer]|uniref:Uncharacterized protein LOC108888437 n=1 Tax=Lates calcarifer TaxID=8187 RepID=A0AAJ8DL86_LATCA|nr:uncharacterized protein LOC108888437 [Lates calcarifer]